MNRLAAPLIALFVAVSLADLQGFSRGYETFFASLALVVCGSLLVRQRFWTAIFTAMVYVSLAVCFFAVVRLFFVHGFILPRAKWPFASPNFLGGYCALQIFIAVALAARTRNLHRGIASAAVIVNLLTLALSQSRGAVIAACVGGVIVAPRRCKEIIIGCGGLYLLLIASFGVLGKNSLPLHTGSLENHLAFWRMGFLIARDHLLLGVGQGTLFNRFYSVYLDWLVGTGVLGLGAGLWLLAAMLRAALAIPSDAERRAIVAMIVTWMVYGLFIFDTPATIVPLLVIVSYLGSERRNVNHLAGLVDDGEPFLNRRARSGGADRA